MANLVAEVTDIIVQEIESSITYNDPDYTYERAQRQNEDGWTVFTKAPLGHVVRHEAVHLSDSELRRAYDTAQWAAHF